MLQLELDPRSGERVAVVRCAGRIVFHEEAKSLAETVRPLLEKHQQVILDLTAVHDVDSAGLGTLASLHRYAKDHDRAVVLMNPAAFVRDLLELTHLDRELPVRTGVQVTAEAAA
jgi:anti-anti-sigma factor